MQVVVVLAHPNTDSFSHAVAERAVNAMQGVGHTVHLIDLYRDGFRAAMSADERDAYHSEQPALDPIVIEHGRLVGQSEAIVFIYPTWWSAQPAILKGWLERVMVPGTGFVFDRRGRVRPGLTHVRRIVGISTYGSSRRYVWMVNDNGRRTISRALRMAAGHRTKCAWLGLYSVDTSTPDDRARFLARVERKVAAL
jgi:putative NADPH-quinone reductase